MYNKWRSLVETPSQNLILFFTLSRTNDEIKLLGSMKNDNLFEICEFRTCSIDRESVV